MFQQKRFSFNRSKSLRNNTIIAENRMNKGSARNYMLLKSFRVYCINCVRDAEAVGSSPVASTKKASIERCSLFLSRKRLQTHGLKSRTQRIYRKTWEQRSWGAVVRWTTLSSKNSEAPTEPGGEIESRRLDSNILYLCGFRKIHE